MSFLRSENVTEHLFNKFNLIFKKIKHEQLFEIINHLLFKYIQLILLFQYKFKSDFFFKRKWKIDLLLTFLDFSFFYTKMELFQLNSSHFNQPVMVKAKIIRVTQSNENMLISMQSIKKKNRKSSFFSWWNYAI